MLALGEARTHGLQIMRLTRCLLRYQGSCTENVSLVEKYRSKRQSCKCLKNGFAPGEARTHGLQIMRLTRCLLRYGGKLVTLARFTAKKTVTHGGTRTPNLRFRRPTPYPLGHAGKSGG